ncbi:hypothetical protein GTQ34_08885 [Muricauda sp. JGD-17]|uniref:Uncharacterized protein n=1 Tax=Flagellimonas ochracea TaxID=2696472 RepID=A0A964WXP6_9FLAO|nr:hypothetical protein [Allomuricauda ochracea]NAY92033.1 hypothetical protein [Allomuricauda ochracea]
MKKTILMLCALGIVACSSNDNNDIEPTGEKWVLNSVVCFCFFGDNVDFSTHTIQFDRTNKNVVIENDEVIQFLAPEGTYPYTVDGSVITILERQYRYQEDGDSLILTFVDEPLIADDEITYFYSRN